MDEPRITRLMENRIGSPDGSVASATPMHAAVQQVMMINISLYF